MANKMLIDAMHPEETRVVVLRGSRVEEFDFESASKRQLRGNIYLAKVIRVEPSLQAAFVDYGGNRHGFLAFSEIHPDYYQIPVSDRQALLEDEAHDTHEEEEERRPRRSRRRRGDRTQPMDRRSDDEVVSERLAVADGDQDEGAGAQAASPDEPPFAEADRSDAPPHEDPTGDLLRHASDLHDPEPQPTAPEALAAEQALPASVAGDDIATGVASDESAALARVPAFAPESEVAPPFERAELAEAASVVDPNPLQMQAPATATSEAASDADVDTGSSVMPAEPSQDGADEATAREADHGGADEHDHHDDEEHVDQLGGDALEEVPHRTYRPRRQYKIQEVIKRRQVLLVQVVKEERGNKGAALTTYLSLAGRYSVLMPNTARGGGISRKITDAGDRQRLKSIAQELEVPDGMGVILRTAGASRTKPEVKRDFEYLMRMWETVRETTLASSAPTLVYEEGSLIKRAIRDLYNKEVEEVVVAGEGGYREAKDFMRLLMPSHAKNVQLWRDPAPLFTKAGAEAQLDAMFSNHVTLKSGGYLVINQTEALVAIDVNSGRSTREHNIEDTALRTNLEAADEVARQLRLRDLAGLIVVDFIDMEETRNNRSVERRLKDALKDDRARIQVGRISHFGLLEMSRQRIRTGVLEGSTEICPHCAGTGSVRSTASIALHVLRVMEDALLADASRNITVRTRSAVALYILNGKRAHVSDLEARFGAAVTFESDETLTGTTYCGLERGEPSSGIITAPSRPTLVDEPEAEIFEEIEAEEVTETADDDRSSEEGSGSRRRRRRRGRGRDRESSGVREDAPQPSDEALGMLDETAAAPTAALVEAGMADALGPDGQDGERVPDEGRARKRRSRRGGRRSRDSQSRHSEDGVENPEHDGLGGALVGDAAEADTTDDVMANAGATQADMTPADITPADLLQADAAEPGVAVHEPPAAEQPDVGLAASTPPASFADMGARHDTPDSVDPTPVPAPAPAADPMTIPDGPGPVGQTLEDVATLGGGEDDASARPRRPEPISSEADPSRPKRSGWWQRAKATLTN